MSTIQATPPIKQLPTATLFAKTFADSPSVASILQNINVSEVSSLDVSSMPATIDVTNITIVPFGDHLISGKSNLDILKSKIEWKDKEYREFYAEAAVEQGLAFQIRINREKRRITQKDLAKAINTRQSAISRMEDPDYGAHSLTQLQKVAHAFDCALIVKFASFSTLARESKSLSEEQIYALSYEDEIIGK